MFSKEDYRNYFSEMESIFKESLIIYTDLVNELSDQAARNKLLTLAEENMDAFNFVQKIKGNFLQK